MSHERTISLIITTYNWPGALKITLGSVLGQTRLPEEIIVADDGSGPETAHVVEGLLRPSRIRWSHVWHDDKGVRQSRIKNLAVKFSQSTYLIFIDHDTVLHPSFIADHASLACEGSFLQGKRVLLPRGYTDRILDRESFKVPSLWLKGLRNRKNIFRSPLLGRLFTRPKRFQNSLRGCNLSLFKSDFCEVDGFDEIFDQSWGREDSDICYRLFHNGLFVRNLWFTAIQYHLHHNLIASWERERLDSELKKNLQEKRLRAIKGFSKLASEGAIIAASDYDSREAPLV